MLSAEDVIDLLGITLIGVVPEDETVLVGSNRGTPVALDVKSRAGQAFRNIAKRIKGEEVPFLEMDRQAGIWSRLQKIAGRR
jgi:septum site-determining protein MinD